MNSFAKSALAGLLATGPMTLFMTEFHKRLPPGEKSPLPPRKITMKVADKAGVKEKLNGPQRLALTLFGHFSYGGLAGSLFFPLMRSRRIPSAVGGIGYGLLVWAGSYLGWLPLTDLHRSAARMTPKRNALMIGAHIVWGATLGVLYDVENHSRPSGWSPARIQVSQPNDA